MEDEPRCVNHPTRRGTFLRRTVDGGIEHICATCWRQDHVQGAITTDAELIDRAPLTDYEKEVLKRRLRG